MTKPEKPVRISGVAPYATPGVGGGWNMGAINTGKQLAFISAFLFLIAAAISLYLAWRNIQGGNAPEVLF